MLDTQEFGNMLKDMGLVNFVGVPCSYLSPLINYAINESSFIMSNNEGDAIAIASGISLGNFGNKDKMAQRTYGIALMQNSGLSNALSPLTSLNYTFDIPILGFVSLRGERDCNGQNTDEPQHELLGVITDKILETCVISYAFLESDSKQAKIQIKEALKILEQNKSFFFIVRDKTFSKVELRVNPIANDGEKKEQSKIITVNGFKNSLPTAQNLMQYLPDCDGFKQEPARLQALTLLHYLAKNSNAVLLATTGKCGRELYEINDTPNQLYMVGSMGCVSSLALGISLKAQHKVIAIDGDSALLMRLGALSTNAYYANKESRKNFCHVVLDNNIHDSTGGQFNLSPFVDFPAIAKNCGYKNIFVVQNLCELEWVLHLFLESKSDLDIPMELKDSYKIHEMGSWFIYLRIAKGSKKDLGRPKITPKEVARRLESFLQTSRQ